MTDNFTPEHSTDEMHEKYESRGLLRKWKDFLDCGKNTALRNAVFESQNHICPKCGKTISSIGVGCVAHHLTYDNACSYQADKIIQPTPTRYRPYRTLSLCDCSACSRENAEGFKKCKASIVLMHKSCHAIVHDKPA